MPHRRRGRDKKVPGQPHNVRERGARIRNLSRASTVRRGGNVLRSAPLRSAQLFEARRRTVAPPTILGCRTSGSAKQDSANECTGKAARSSAAMSSAQH